MHLRFIPLILCLLVLAGCAPRTQSGSSSGRLPDLLPPAVTLVDGGAVLSSFDPPGAGASARISVALELSNPNSFPLHLSSLDFTYTLGDSQQVGSGSAVPDVISLLPGGSTQVDLQLERSLARDLDLMQAVADTVAGGSLYLALTVEAGYSSSRHSWLSSREYQLEGGVRATSGVELPGLVLLADESSAYSVEAGFPMIRVLLQVSNPGSIGYLVHGKDLVLELAGQPVALLDLPPSPVPALGMVQLALSFTPSPELLSPAARTALSDALAGATTEVTVRGALALDVLGLGTFELPSAMQLTALIHSD